MSKTLSAIKCVTIVAFMVTLCSTYYLRSEVLKLSTLRFSSENIRAEDELREMKESYPLRVAEYEVETKNYDLEMEHYQSMLTLYRTDYDEYVQKLKDHFEPPKLPRKPEKPTSPELSDRLAKISAEFRAQQFAYYDSTSRLNWVCCVSSLFWWAVCSS